MEKYSVNPSKQPVKKLHLLHPLAFSGMLLQAKVSSATAPFTHCFRLEDFFERFTDEDRERMESDPVQWLGAPGHLEWAATHGMRFTATMLRRFEDAPLVQAQLQGLLGADEGVEDQLSVAPAAGDLGATHLQDPAWFLCPLHRWQLYQAALFPNDPRAWYKFAVPMQFVGPLQAAMAFAVEEVPLFLALHEEADWEWLEPDVFRRLCECVLQGQGTHNIQIWCSFLTLGLKKEDDIHNMQIWGDALECVHKVVSNWAFCTCTLHADTLLTILTSVLDVMLLFCYRERPVALTAQARAVALALHDLDHVFFHKALAQLLGRIADGSEMYEYALHWWTVMGLPFECRPYAM